ncbi:MAG TPA: DUF885 family protein, partial [Woeseiaceae bacterium]
MMANRRLMTAIFLLFACPTLQAAPQDDFNALLSEAWEWQLVENPLFASRLGDRRFDARWPDLSIEAIERRQQDQRVFLDRLSAIDVSRLDETARLNYDLFRRELQTDLETWRFRSYLMPVHHRGGVQNLDTTAETLRLATVTDYENWLERMAGVERYIAQTMDLQERGRRAGYMPPAILMQRVPDQVAAQLVENAEDSPFFTAFANMPDNIPPDEQERLRQRATALIDGEIVPAYRRFS